MASKVMIYKNDIEPKLKEILKICNENSIPFFTAFGTSVEKNGELDLKVNALIPEMFDDCKNVHDPAIADMINIASRKCTTCLKHHTHTVEFTVEQGENDFRKNWVKQK